MIQMKHRVCPKEYLKMKAYYMNSFPNRKPQANMEQLGGMIQNISQRVDILNLPASTTVPAQPLISTASSSQLWEPAPRPVCIFECNPEQCGGIILQCELTFSRSPSLFVSSSAKIYHLIASLCGTPLECANSHLQTHPTNSLSFNTFLQELNMFSICLSNRRRSHNCCLSGKKRLPYQNTQLLGYCCQNRLGRVCSERNLPQFSLRDH